MKIGVRSLLISSLLVAVIFVGFSQCFLPQATALFERTTTSTELVVSTREETTGTKYHQSEVLESYDKTLTTTYTTTTFGTVARAYKLISPETSSYMGSSAWPRWIT